MTLVYKPGPVLTSCVSGQNLPHARNTRRLGAQQDLLLGSSLQSRSRIPDLGHDAAISETRHSTKAMQFA